ncbi:MAG: ribokinase [Parabacteroides distasonis]|nr:ribokinase [Parabacteroides distasonis]
METDLLCCIGHITLDKIVTPKMMKHMPGGTAFYFAHALSCLDTSRFQLVTALGIGEMEVVEALCRKGIRVKVLPSARSVYFENIYGENQDNRTQRVLAKADPFTEDGLLDIKARIIHLGTLLADDFSLDVVKFLSTKGLLSVDAQGYLREVRGESVYAVDWSGKLEALQYIHILKANEHETEVLTGCSDPRQAAVKLAEWGVKEVLLTLGSMGSVIYAEGQFYEIPAYPPKEVVDATGCGDTYMAGYLYKRSQGASYQEAGRFAAAMCTLKLEASGPFDGTEDDIRRVIETYKP